MTIGNPVGIAEAYAPANKFIGHLLIIAKVVLVPDIYPVDGRACNIQHAIGDLGQPRGIGAERRGITGHCKIGARHADGLGPEANQVEAIVGVAGTRQ